MGGRGNSEIEFGDGVLTRIGTFQKYFVQSELHEYIEQVLEVDAVPAAPGVFYVFRDEELREQFLATRYRRRGAAPRKRQSEQRFEEYRAILEPLMDWIAAQGRVPEKDEFAGAGDIEEAFGSLRRAFALIRRVTGEDDWEKIRQKRAEDLLVYLALANFRRRPKMSRLPRTIQRDVRAFFGTYKRACLQADEMLFRAGDADSVDEACKRSPIGKLLPNALYVHRSALNDLDPLLRVYEGCGRAYLGEIDGANIIKLHRFSGKLSYLVYPGFEGDPHPTLLRCIKLAMRTRELFCYDYSQSENPPVLHRKDSFLAEDHPLREKFARLTRQQERHGLLDDTSRIGTRRGWEEHLAERGYRLVGHRLVRAK